MLLPVPSMTGVCTCGAHSTHPVDADEFGLAPRRSVGHMVYVFGLHAVTGASMQHRTMPNETTQTYAWPGCVGPKSAAEPVHAAPPACAGMLSASTPRPQGGARHVDPLAGVLSVLHTHLAVPAHLHAHHVPFLRRLP